MNFAQNITVKHAFFALEACQAGEIVALMTLGDPFRFPHPNGYVLSDNVQRPVRQFLTAGSANDDVLARSPFTALLVAALENGEGYVTGSEVVSFVKQKVPQAVPGQQPDSGAIPMSGAGDFIFGPAAIGPPPRLPPPPPSPALGRAPLSSRPTPSSSQPNASTASQSSNNLTDSGGIARNGPARDPFALIFGRWQVAVPGHEVTTGASCKSTVQNAFSLMFSQDGVRDGQLEGEGLQTTTSIVQNKNCGFVRGTQIVGSFRYRLTLTPKTSSEFDVFSEYVDCWGPTPFTGTRRDDMVGFRELQGSLTIDNGKLVFRTASATLTYDRN